MPPAWDPWHDKPSSGAPRASSVVLCLRYPKESSRWPTTRIPDTHPAHGNHTQARKRSFTCATIWSEQDRWKIASGTALRICYIQGGIEFLKNKTVLFTNTLFLPKRILYFRCFGKTAEPSSLGPKTPKCCNPKPLAVTKTCLQVESFQRGASRAVLSGCVFACFLGAKGFPPRLPRTGELGSALFGVLVPSHLCPLLKHPEQFGNGTSQLGDPSFPYLQIIVCFLFQAGFLCTALPAPKLPL